MREFVRSTRLYSCVCPEYTGSPRCVLKLVTTLPARRFVIAHLCVPAPQVSFLPVDFIARQPFPTRPVQYLNGWAASPPPIPPIGLTPELSSFREGPGPSAKDEGLQACFVCLFGHRSVWDAPGVYSGVSLPKVLTKQL